MLVSDYIETNYPLLFNIFVLFGIIEKQWFNEESTDPFVPAFERKSIHYDRFSKIVKNPRHLAEEIYNWGIPHLTAIFFWNVWPLYSKVLGYRSSENFWTMARNARRLKYFSAPFDPRKTIIRRVSKQY